MLFVRFLDDANSNVYLAVCHVVLLDNVFVLLVEFEDTVELLSCDRLILINHQISKVDDSVTLAVNQQGQRIFVILVQFNRVIIADVSRDLEMNLEITCVAVNDCPVAVEGEA